MFCPKCGTRVPDGAGFCPKCGTGLDVGTTNQKQGEASAGQARAVSGMVPADTPKKKKRGKLFAILGIAALIVVVAVIASSLNGEKTDYTASVKAHEPFAESQGLNGTYADVLGKYMDPPDWKERQSDDVHYVDIGGTIRGTDHKLAVTIKASPHPDMEGMLSIKPDSVTLDDKKTYDENDAVLFLINMFMAYDEGYRDLSGLLYDTESPEKMREKISLSEIYENAEDGISFKYPGTWKPFSLAELSSYYGVSESELENTVDAMVDKVEGVALELAKFSDSPKEYADRFLSDEEFALEPYKDASDVNTSVTKLDGVPARMIFYVEGGVMQRRYCYGIGSEWYRLTFAISPDKVGDRKRFLEAYADAVMGTYSIAAANTPSGKEAAETEDENTEQSEKGKDTEQPAESKDTEQPTESTAAGLLYKGIPVDTIMGASAEDLIAAWGEPDERSEGHLAYYNDNALISLDGMGSVVEIGSGSPENFVLNGQALKQDYDTLVGIFGTEPDSQSMEERLETEWTYDGYSFSIGLDMEDGTWMVGNVIVR